MTLSAVASNFEIPSAFQKDEQARIRATLGRASVFAGLPAAAIDDLARRVSVRRALGGHPLVAQDEPGDALYLIMAGRVKIVVFGDSGREVTLSVLRAGDIFGEMAVFDGARRSAHVVAIDPTTVLVLSREDLLRHMAAHAETSLRLLGEMARRLRRADETIAELALCDVSERLVRKLLGLAKEEGGEDPEGLVNPRRPRHQDQATMVSTRAEALSRTFNSLARKGLIVPRGRGLVVTRRLVAMTETPAKAA